MLFNSYEFIFLFLPVVWAMFYLLGRSQQMLAAAWMACASVFFYGFWDPHYVPLLLASIAANYLIGKKICDEIDVGRQLSAKRWLQAGLVFDLGLLGYYKYTGFILGSWVDITGSSMSVPNIILPLGISFFTFTQIAYLVDAYRGVVKERNPVHYLLFISYFPHLIAGPVLHHKQMMPQFAQAENYRINHENIAVGLTIFTIGMVKKMLIADPLSHYANPAFAVSMHQDGISMSEAWLGGLAYTFQLYFDFSGYSDMAIGLSRLFGVRLPLNFNSPYKARSINEFWLRWHMTLSRFLREYVYIPLGGSRKGPVRRYINLFLTMFLGGIWHGAGWTFVVWGAVQGSWLMIHHYWNEHGFKLQLAKAWQIKLVDYANWIIFFTLLVMTMVIFRSASLTDAWTLLQAMVSLGPDHAPSVINHANEGWQCVIIAALICFFAPNTQQIMWNYKPIWDSIELPKTRLLWHPNKITATITALCFVYCVVNLTKVSEFLYFQF